MRVFDLYNGDLTCQSVSPDTDHQQVTTKVDLANRTALPSSNSWTCQQNNANNAYYVVPSTGEVNNNNKNNTNAVVPVAELDRLSKFIFEAESNCWKNKKDNPAAVKYHYNLKPLFTLKDALYDSTYKPKNCMCFIIHTPLPREVFASQYEDRIVHHLVAPFIYEVADTVHRNNGDICHGNRKNHSALSAAFQVQQNMRKYPNGVVASMDITGFFMSISRQKSFEVFKEFCEQYTPKEYTEKEIEFMLRLIYLLLQNDPTDNCIRNSPIEEWSKIRKDKTLFGKIGVGLPIGNFYSQLIANLLASIWGSSIQKLNLQCTVTQFVDDACFVADSMKTMRIIRKQSFKILDSIGLKLHLKKFYIQPVHHGVRFCGRVIFTDRMYTINRTIHNCEYAIHKYMQNITLENAKKLLCSFNSYTGLMCYCNEYKNQVRLSKIIEESKYSKWLYFKKQRSQIICQLKNEYKLKEISKNTIIELRNKQSEYEFKYNKAKCSSK